MNNMTKETHQLIAANKVEGTAVFGVNKERMGSVKTVMLGKRDGKVHHAILSIGGFLGMGDELHSLPWDKLDYDTDLEGYKLSVTEDQLRSAPTFGANDDKSDDEDFQRRSYAHYGAATAW